MKMFTARLTTKALLLSTLALLFTGCQEQRVDNDSSVQLTSVTSEMLVAANDYQVEQHFTGTIRSGNTTAIGFELAGKIKLIAVDSGDQVKKGQVLAKLDTALLEAQEAELEANLAQNNADLQLAKSTLERSLSLKKQGYTSEQQLDELKGQLNSLQAAKQRLSAAVAANRLKITKSTLIAPFNGVVAKRNNNLGEVVATGSPLFTLIENNNPQAIVGVPIDIAQTLRPAQTLELTVNKKPYQGKIAGVGAEVNPITRTVPVRFTLPNNSLVLNGELVYLSYQQTIQRDGFWVPLSSLTDGIRGVWNIYILQPQSANQYQIERRDIDIIYTNGEQAYVTGAIVADERYVTQGLHKLVAGELVTLSSDIAAR
ncbi:efflux RND transporter periplasmic adaptor subunit [Shewanella sp. Isolate11]|uniref:efflux RND transporter periplasmic adaptor subunit n=1 Tax=Shewanella sp. Isolate11 TaxID=2908530 RepID=UPI001EFC9067|nr:efflux RND transporter periplasmic adaptor subunit [Shewanella sp. Isolate11]MCG9697192.1 efflux RND transporter periplasmic adaptor subunit [Shewanella sp. Isolate11]